MGKSRTDLPGRDDVPPTPCFGRVTRAKQPRTVRGPTTRPSPHCGRLDPSRPKQLDRYFVTAIRSEQPDRFTITYVVVAVRLPSSVRFGHSNYESYEPWSNQRHISGTAQLGRNGRTPRSSGPAGKAAERGATSPTANHGPARGTPSGAPIRRRPVNDRGWPSSEAPGSAKVYQTIPARRPRIYRLPEFILFSGNGQTSSIEHIGRFTAQKLRLFVHSLTGVAFSWFINLPPNSVRDWSDMERIFHEHFYHTKREITVAELARMSQASDESPRNYLQQFKTCRNWCRTNLPEREFVKIAKEVLEFEYRNMHDLINKVDRYASLLKEEVQKKMASKGTYYRNPVVSYAETNNPAEAEGDEVEMSSAEVNIDKPFVCKGLVKADNSRTKIPDTKFATRQTKAYTFDLTRAKAIFDLLLTEKKVKLSFGHKIPKPEELKGKTFCKYHSSWSHNTNNCVVLRDVIQKLIDEKKLQFPEKATIQVDSKPLRPPVINMVNA
ncbi:unnamed protein product [Prunus armeniaca]